jgi:hypothetical protein
MSSNKGDEEVARAALRGLKEDLPPGDFEFRLHQKLVAAGPPEVPSAWHRAREALSLSPLRWPIAAGALAVAALCLTFYGWAPFSLSKDEHGATAEVVEVPASKVALVRVNVSATVAVADASIRVTLPDGLSFYSEAGTLAQRTVQWSQPLSVGNNEIPIAVRGARPGRYHVWLSAQIGQEDVEDEVVIEVTQG